MVNYLISFLLICCTLDAFSTEEKAYSYLQGYMQHFPKIEFTLKKEVVMSTAHVFMSDIADCKGSLEICSEISGVQIAKSPRPNSSLLLKKSDIEAQVHQEWPRLEAEIIGPHYVKVTSNFQLLSSQTVRTIIEDILADKIKEVSSTRIKIEKLRLYDPPYIMDQDFKLEFPELNLNFGSELDAANIRNLRKVKGQLINLSDETNPVVVDEFYVYLDLTLERLLPVLSQDVGKDQELTNSALRMKWVPLNRTYSDYMAMNQLVNKEKMPIYRTKRKLKEGSAIRKSDLVSVFRIERGAVVDFTVVESNLAMTGKAKAIDSASKGETIMLELLATKKRVFGKVVDVNQVEVKF